MDLTVRQRMVSHEPLRLGERGNKAKEGAAKPKLVTKNYPELYLKQPQVYGVERNATGLDALLMRPEIINTLLSIKLTLPFAF